MLKTIVVGSGLVTVVKHLPVLLDHSQEIKVVALCDLNEENAKKVAERFHIKKTYKDFTEALVKETPDVVDICTPPHTHAKLAMLALESGAHVLIEKPMTLKLEDCDKIINAALKYNRKVKVLHNQIYNPVVRKAKEMISNGRIGEFLGMRVLLSTPTSYLTDQKNHWAHKLPGGAMGETCPHAVYLTTEFIKNINSVEVCAKKILPQYPWSRFEDYRVNLVGEDRLCSVTLSYGSNQWSAIVELFGSTGVLKLDLESRVLINYKRNKLKNIEVAMSSLSEAGQIIGSVVSNGFKKIMDKGFDPHHFAISRFLSDVAAKKYSIDEAQQGREVVKIMGLIVAALENKYGKGYNCY